MTQPATDAADTRMLTAAEACTQIGIGKTKFYDLINQGELTAVDISPNAPAPRRIGDRGHRRVLRIAQAEVDRFLAERTVRA